MSTPEAAFVAKIRDQLRFLRDPAYAYSFLRVYVSGIREPWEFGRADEFKPDGDQLLVARVGSAAEHGHGDVPEFVFPLRHVVATELAAVRWEDEQKG